MSSRHLVDPELWPAMEKRGNLVYSLDILPKVREAMETGFQAYSAPTDDGIERRELTVPGLNGAPPVPVVVYAPKDAGAKARPGVFYIHGGGYFCGRPIYSDAWSRRLVRELGCVLVATSYRLSPETRAPGPTEDCYAALLWMHSEAKSLGVDPARIAIEGVSAGGGLAAGLTLMARDRQEAPICFQLLTYPMLDDRIGRPNGPPRLPYAGEFGFSYDGAAFGWGALLGDAVAGPDVSPYVAPARATDLRGLPPAFIGASALDPLMQEDVAYAMRLIEAGVPTELHLSPGAYHGFDAYDEGKSRVGEAFRKMRIDALSRGLGV